MIRSAAKSLKRSEIFYNLPDSVIQSLVDQVEPVTLEKGKILFHKGDIGDALYLLEEGWVKFVGEDKDGQEVVFNQEGPGAVFGEMALIDNEPRSAGVVALTDAKLLKLSRKSFLDVMEAQPILGQEIAKNIITRLRLATTYIELAIEWSKEIAAGNYDYVEQQTQTEGATVVAANSSDRERATRFLGTFFQMVKDVRAREEQLKKELTELKVVIDHQRRKKEVAELTENEFFRSLRKKKKQQDED
ncbi:MAG TPA: cyclic nucleotide-binding domain-containing protein [Anaerolineales bacterium]|nr:cyclic nucleotide-binding domain-containing protein [Anaerolineales bacterium]